MSHLITGSSIKNRQEQLKEGDESDILDTVAIKEDGRNKDKALWFKKNLRNRSLFGS